MINFNGSQCSVLILSENNPPHGQTLAFSFGVKSIFKHTLFDLLGIGAWLIRSSRLGSSFLFNPTDGFPYFAIWNLILVKGPGGLEQA